jgi:hypothetical protein
VSFTSLLPVYLSNLYLFSRDESNDAGPSRIPIR